MKFAIITDLHHGPEGAGIKDGVQRKLVSETLSQVEHITEVFNKMDDIDFIVNLGDSIEDVNDESIDIQYFTEIQNKLSHLKSPLYTLIGNHEQRTLTHEKLRELLDLKSLHYSFKVKGVKFIALHVKMLGDHTVVQSDIRAGIDEEQLQWLQEELEEDMPTVIFSHYSVAEMNLTGNFWFEDYPQHALISNRADVRKILEMNNNVIAFLNGHVHWNNMTVHNKIPYITQQSVSENFTGNGTPAGTYSVVEITEDAFDMVMYGNDRVNVKFDLR